MRARYVALGLLAFLLLGLATPVAGQVFVDASQNEVVLNPGETERLNVTFSNPTSRAYFVSGKATGNLSGQTTLDPSRFPLAPDAERTTNVTITAPEGTEFVEGELLLEFTIVDRESGQPIQSSSTIHLRVERAPLLLGLYENPLPPPLDDNWGMFAVEMVAWLAVAALVVSVISFLVHHLISTTEFIQDEMAAMVKAPVFYLVVVLGLNYSWRLVPRTPVIDITARLLDAIAILVAAVLAYKASGAGLLYYGKNIAGETETKVDDVLVPVLEKLSAAVIIGMAAFYTFQVLGVDLSFLVAGGLVVGLVISMAAQDTLSNFFSGIYLLIDRPFREGDEIQLDTGEICRVEEVGMRSSELYHYRNHQLIVVPNNDLASKRVINLSFPDKYYRLVIPIGVSYNTDLKQAKDALHRVAMENEDVQKGRNTAPRVFVREFGDSSINLELRVFVPDSRDRNRVRTDLISTIHERFAEEGIEIPFPQRVVHMRDQPDGAQGPRQPPSREPADVGEDGNEDGGATPGPEAPAEEPEFGAEDAPEEDIPEPPESLPEGS